LAIFCLLCFGLTGLGWVFTGAAGTYREEFDSDKLDENLWEIKLEGDASYKIENGQITMTSPAVEDGILIYWKGGDITNEDFSFEISAQVGPEAQGAAVIAFVRQLLPPMLNTVINAEWKTCFFCGTNNQGWYINDDDWNRTPASGPEKEGVWKAELKGDKIYCYFNDEEVVVYDKITEERYVCFGPDVFTSHYVGEMTVDWIELSGPTVQNAAVEAAEKLSVTWGSIKIEGKTSKCAY